FHASGCAAIGKVSLDASTRCTGHVSGRDGHPNISFQATRRAKATTNADATINTCQSCVPPTFRSDLLKRAKHAGHLYASKLLAVPNLVPHCGHVISWEMYGKIK